MLTLSRRDWIQALSAAAAGCILAVPESEALAAGSASVQWVDVQLPPDERAARREKLLRTLLVRESHHANWGASSKSALEASVKVVEFVVVRRPTVLRVTCTALGKLRRGPAVRTHFSFGGAPSQQDQLEKTMLTLIAQGLVTRLSAIAREKSPPKGKEEGKGGKDSASLAEE